MYDIFSKTEYVGFIEKLYEYKVISEKEYSKLKIQDFKYYFSDDNYVFCHSDYNPKNIIIKDGKVVGIVDFEWACSANPWDDLATFHLFAELEGFENYIDNFYDGYQSIKPINEHYFKEIEFYKFYSLICMLSYQVSDEKFNNDFIDNMSMRLSEFLRR